MWAREGLVRFNSERQGRAGSVQRMFATICKSVEIRSRALSCSKIRT